MKRREASVLTAPGATVLAVLGIITFLIRDRPDSLQVASSPGPSIPFNEEGKPYRINGWKRVEDLPRSIAVFETVFWEPADTESLRELIRSTSLARGKSILEIGTGSGLISLCCLQAGATRVVATDVNPAAVANARYNARRLDLDDRLEVRQVSLDNAAAYAVIKDSERFDLIISNPPWEDQTPASIDQYALYDPHFELLRTLLDGLRDRLRPGGRALLAYGCREAIDTLYRLAEEHDLRVRILDERNLEDLPEVFLPGMLLEVTPEPLSSP